MTVFDRDDYNFMFAFLSKLIAEKIMFTHAFLFTRNAEQMIERESAKFIHVSRKSTRNPNLLIDWHSNR